MQKDTSQIIKAFQQDGPDKCHVLADFDKTVTRAFAPDGSKVPSLISVLRDQQNSKGEPYLQSDYPVKAHALYAKYGPLENDDNLSKDERKAAMQEWWTKHFELLIASRLNLDDIDQAVQSQRLRLRDDALEVMRFLRDHHIPLVFISATGLGVKSISAFFEINQCNFENIRIVGNQFVWNDEGYAVGVVPPIIHSLNKDETVLKDFPFYAEVEARPNVLLLGDSLDDPDMVVGFDYQNLLKIGFDNEAKNAPSQKFQEKFDLVITHDGPMTPVLKILQEMFL